MKLVVTEDVFELFPEAKVAILVARGIDNRGSSGFLAPSLRRAQELAASKLGEAPMAEHPRIRCWREAYRAFGAKPKDNPSSVENLARRALTGGELRPINKLVDLYNVVSLTHLLPAGGEDLDAIEGDVVLTRASSAEPKVRLLGESEERAPRPGEVIYRDARGALCRRWNWKEAERTKLTEATTNALLVLEAIPPVSAEDLREALGHLGRLVGENCDGRLHEAILDRGRREAPLD